MDTFTYNCTLRMYSCFVFVSLFVTGFLRCANGAVICYWDEYLDVIGPSKDNIRYPFDVLLCCPLVAYAVNFYNMLGLYLFKICVSE